MLRRTPSNVRSLRSLECMRAAKCLTRHTVTPHTAVSDLGSVQFFSTSRRGTATTNNGLKPKVASAYLHTQYRYSLQHWEWCENDKGGCAAVAID
jgi:hypothetical protein